MCGTWTVRIKILLDWELATATKPLNRGGEADKEADVEWEEKEEAEEEEEDEEEEEEK